MLGVVVLAPDVGEERPGDARPEHGAEEGRDPPQCEVLGAVVGVGETFYGERIINSEIYAVCGAVTEAQDDNRHVTVDKAIADVDQRHAEA